MTTYGVTNIHPLALLATVVAAVFLLTGKRSQAMLAIALVACLIPAGQRVIIAGLNFNMIRFLVLFGWMRLVARGELRGIKVNEIDLSFGAWIVASTAVYVIREGSTAALVYRLGLAFDALGIYFLFRVLLHRPTDVAQAARYMAICTALVMVPMTVEWATGRNLFAVFGGVPLETMVRDGRLRCQGAFSHPIMAGSFGATLVPMFVGMYLAFPRWRTAAIVGAISGVVITVAAASSGPMMSLLAGLLGLALWPLRRHTRAMRWGTLATLTVVHFARDRPVWHLIVRVSNLIGGEGYHRYALIDAFVKNWQEWFWLGTSSTAHWGFVLFDTTNQYVDEGVNGGIFAVVTFVALLAFSFRGVGIAGKAGGLVGRTPSSQALWCWGLGCGLFAHAVGFISVSYFGQMRIIFCMIIALIAAERSFVAVALEARAGKRMKQHQPAALPSLEGSSTDPGSDSPLRQPQ